MISQKIKFRLLAVTLVAMFVATLPYIGYEIYNFALRDDLNMHFKIIGLTACAALLIAAALMCFMFSKVFWNKTQ